MTSRCVDEDELLRLLDGELTENDAERLREHVRGCGVCAARSEGLARTLRALKAPLAGVDPDAAVEDVMRRLPSAAADDGAMHAPRRISRWSFLAAGLAAAIAMGAVVVAPKLLHGPGEDSGSFGARGAPLDGSTARAVGVRVRRTSREGAALTPDAHVRADDAYAVSYENLLGEPVYLLAFAVDSTANVHWICPAYLDPKTNPAAIALAPSTMETSLSPAMQLDAPAHGPLRFVALLSPSPLHVQDVDRLRGDELAPAALRARFPGADLRELVTVYVDPSW